LISSSSAPDHTLQWSAIFFHIISYRHDFPKKYFWSNMCILFSLQIFFEIFPIIRKFEGKLIKNIRKSSSQRAVFLVRFTLKLNFPDGFSKNIQISRVRKFLPVGADLLHAYRRSDKHDETNSLFSEFDAPNKEPFVSTFKPTKKVSITQIGNFAETRP